MRLRGVVVEGKRLGRKLGFPTANILVAEDLGIEDGVYRSRVEVDGVEYVAVSNVGRNPTIGGESRRVESYILDFEGDLYGRTLSIELVERVREERKFDSIEALRDQVMVDIEHVRAHK